MTPLPLFRAVAYPIQWTNTPLSLRWPEVAVFFEARTPAEAPAQLLRLLAQAWHLEPADIDFYNLFSEAELQFSCSAAAVPGEAYLLENGMGEGGPLFCNPARTLMLVSPPNLHRLTNARSQACLLLQRRLDKPQATPRRNVARRPEFEALADMGGFC